MLRQASVVHQEGALQVRVAAAKRVQHPLLLVGAVHFETVDGTATTNNPGAASSISGGGQSSSSSATADHNVASSSITSGSGGCP